MMRTSTPIDSATQLKAVKGNTGYNDPDYLESNKHRVAGLAGQLNIEVKEYKF